MVSPTLREFLDDHRVPYRVLSHEERFTAQETAAAAHVSGRRIAKVVLLETSDGHAPELLLAAVPANEEVDLDRLGRAIGRPLGLARERDFERVCPDFDLGAAPPFGALTHLPIVVDSCLGRGGTIVFNGGTHTDLVEMAWEDFTNLERPRIVECGRLPIPREPAAPLP
jgi:Ala-tRNA(Pro) deacylase